MTQEGRLTWMYGCQAKHKEESCRKIRKLLILEVLWVCSILKEEMYLTDPTLTRKTSSELI